MRAIAQEDPLYPGWVHKSFAREGQFLGITEVLQALKQSQTGRVPDMVTRYNNAQRNLEGIMEIYRALPTKQFPVVRLRHVTIEAGFRGIVEEGKIKGCNRTFLLNGVERTLRVSCWGAHIPPKKMEAYGKKRMAQFMQLATANGIDCDLSPEASAEVRDMLVNSPAMREDSRYGNFQFSFNTKDLLAMYQDQHCGGQKPVLRVLGTEAYKLELVHWILVHSPALRQFNNLPTVDPPGAFSRDGNLMWSPESMTSQFVYEISNSTLTKKPLVYSRNRQIQTFDPWIWNNAVFAFYLPNNSALRIDRSSLLQNVQACETTRSLNGDVGYNILRHLPELYTSKESAQATIDTMKIQRGM